MSLLANLGGALGLGAIVYMLVIFGMLSHRLGAVIKMPPHYRWFYVSAGLAGLALLAYLAGVSLSVERASSAVTRAADLLLSWYHLPLALGLTLSLGVAWRYWSWLLRER
ncbi:MAG: hypothetical protein HY023_01015 [Chloroflexi bacterium]|nr:hypothetical protein [Chloroflexota bacterium]MBI3760277.1 hypothetical protein [Chloroflexota bacterium]